MMLLSEYQRHRPMLRAPKVKGTLTQSMSGTLSPETTATTSSGYSTGCSSVSTAAPSSTRKSSTAVVHKPTTTKGFRYLMSRLKNFISTPNTKLVCSPSMRTSASTQCQYSTTHEPPLLSSSASLTTSNTISLPFTYYHESPVDEDSTIRASNFEHVAAWLHHAHVTDDDGTGILFIDEIAPPSSTSPTDNDNQGSISNMKKSLPSTTRTPKRSTSMVSTMIRPVIEMRQYARAVSPTPSFSSSILARGMSEAVSPQKSSYQLQPMAWQEKSNRRRAIDFARRRTVADPAEQTNSNNKENVPSQPSTQLYRFASSTSAVQMPKTYFFHSNPPLKNDDMSVSLYGSTPLQQRHSVSTVVMTSRAPAHASLRFSHKPLNRRPSVQSKSSRQPSESLDDLLCDREVESYFYPHRQSPSTSFPQHVYVNLETPPNHYHPLPFIQGTLC